MNQSSEKALLRQSLQEHAGMVVGAQQAQQAGLLASIQALMGALEARDRYTRGHSERVRAWTIRISRQLGLSKLEIENISLAARLHDIGKVGIRDAILEKAGPLSAEEWQIMRSHPTVGIEILSPIQMLQSTLPIIRGHHERWDGKGYPDGLRGESIPLGSRVIAVADSYEALVTDRPYRKGFSRQKAREILQMGSGMQWEAGMVDALLFVQTHSRSISQLSLESVQPVQDPVCGMLLHPELSQARAIFDNQTFYFCSTGCRELFDHDPDEFLKR
jgi:HD-GYP domain-containing protein (c-di-GMP phosphodiesterase class II)